MFLLHYLSFTFRASQPAPWWDGNIKTTTVCCNVSTSPITNQMPIEGVNIIREERPDLFLILPSQLAPPLELTNITD